MSAMLALAGFGGALKLWPLVSAWLDKGEAPALGQFEQVPA